MRGELASVLREKLFNVGSSPLARGTQYMPALTRPELRFIPACAGNSQGGPMTVDITDGSSPLARGTLRAQRYAVRIRRFIPACAGNSLPDMKVVPPLSVHPRLRGELLTPEPFFEASVGSSPLARGTPRKPLTRPLRRRFIPACAGNS